MKTLTRKSGRPSRDTLRTVRDEIIRRTSALPEGPLRADWTRLDDGEARELADLTRSTEPLTATEQIRWQELVERAAAVEGLFGRLRDFDAIARMAREAKRQLARRPFSPAEERGLLHEVGQQIAGGYLFAGHVGLLLCILSSFERGEAVGLRGTIEGAGDDSVLVIDSRRATVGGDAALDGFKTLLQHLEKNAWVKVGRDGPEWRIRLGSRARRAMKAVT